ncbi:hypothetical protein DFH07DRAFT_965601 [Mycena maculata]|uniref:Uncharacterized protein n=1 Tax=Mycena maculata TaxID=230809 RepID=A0AAD7IC30_9AGAR|nr:hypothetical protein DFH07DRAFT_965601 [Mycena maculata]
MSRNGNTDSGREGSTDNNRSDTGNGKKSGKGKARATTTELRDEAVQRFYDEREQRRVRLISAYQEQAEEAAQRAEVANEEAARALQLIRDLEALDAEAPEFDELPVIETLKSVSPECAEGGGEVDELNDEDDSDVEQEGENVCVSCRKSRQCSRARPLGPPRVNKRCAAQEARRQGSAPVAGPSRTRRNAGTEREDRSDREVHDRTRKERERRVRKAEGKESVRGKLRELEAHVGYLGEQVGRTMLRYKLAYRACQLILKTLAAPESGREVPPGVERMLRWMAADMEASKWDFSLAEQAELDLVAEEPEEDEDAPLAKRRRLMKRGSPEVEEKEVEPVESEDSEAEPEAPYIPELVQTVVATQLGDRAEEHALTMRVRERRGQAIVTRRLAVAAREWLDRAHLSVYYDSLLFEIQAAIHLRDQAQFRDQMDREIVAGRVPQFALTVEGRTFGTRLHDPYAGTAALGSHYPVFEVNPIPEESISFQLSCDTNEVLLPGVPQAGEVILEGNESLGPVAEDEVEYWRTATPFSLEEVMGMSDSPSIPTDEVTAPHVVDEALSTATPNLEPEAVTGPNLLISDAGTAVEPDPRPLTEDEEYELRNPGGYTWTEEMDRLLAARDRRRPHAWRYPGEDDSTEYYHAHRIYRPYNLSGAEESSDDGLMGDTNSEPSETEPDDGQPQGHTDTVVRESYADSSLTMDEEPLTMSWLSNRYVCTARETRNTFVDLHGNLYWRAGELPPTHYLHPRFCTEHEEALELAIHELGASGSIESPVEHSQPTEVVTRDRRGFLDSAPYLLPGTVFHERLASRDPEADDVGAAPGFRVQFLAARVEHSGMIRRPGEVGLMDQPTRPRKAAACISALLCINGTEAYVLIDSGSTTNSMSPEFVHATKAPRIRLEDQVTLQLGILESPPVSDGATTGSSAPNTTRRKVTVETLPEEPEEHFETLPVDYRYQIEKISEIVNLREPTEVPPPLRDDIEEDNSDSESEADEFFFDAEDWDEPCLECHTATMLDQLQPNPILHIDVEHVDEMARTPRRKKQAGMPDISDYSVVTQHSSSHKVSRMNDSDPSGVNDEALEEAVSIA